MSLEDIKATSQVHIGGDTLNSQKLKGFIVANDVSQKNLADAMGISLSRLNAKINKSSGAEFTQSEIAFIKKRYKMTDAEITDIFFNSEMS